MIDIKGSVHKISNFVSRLFSPITTPISQFSGPYVAKWKKFISPITDSWEVYCKRNPRESKIIKWLFGILFMGLMSVVFIKILDGLMLELLPKFLLAHSKKFTGTNTELMRLLKPTTLALKILAVPFGE